MHYLIVNIHISIPSDTMNLSLRQKDTIGDYGVIGIRLFNRTFQLGSENKGVHYE